MPGPADDARLGGEAADRPRPADGPERERRALNLRRTRVIAPVMTVVHAICAALFASLSVAPGGEAAWRDGLVRLHVVAGVVTLGLTAALHLGRTQAGLASVRARAGELFAIYGITVGTATAVNTLAHDFTLTAWIIAVLITSVAVQLRLVTAVVLHAITVAVMIAACLVATPDGALRMRAIANVLVTAGLAFVLARLLVGAFVREVTARLALEDVNGELERRVDAQVGEIVAHATRIEALNRQLASQVQARSLELSAALERLAATQHREDPLQIGGTLVERFEIRRLLGVGGMGVVYAAFDRVAGTEVALKVAHGHVTGVSAAHRFLQEASAAASLDHPAIVRILDVDVSPEGRLYQIQELVDGRTLDTWTALDQPLPPAIVARLGAILADALAVAHAAGVVHRDVKPQNVMVTSRAPGCCLLDFGLAKLRRSLVGSGLTEAGVVVGTPEFLSPEQITTPESVDGATDVYALGLVLYMCAAGRPPFAATSSIQWFNAHLHDAPRPLLGVPASLRAPILACLAKTAAERPSAQALHDRLAAVADALGAPPLATWYLDQAEHATHRMERPGLDRAAPPPPSAATPTMATPPS